MRIEGPRGPDSLKKADKTRKSSGSSGIFSSLIAEEAGSAASAAPMSSLSGIGSLLTVNMEDDPAEKKARARMQERANKVLDSLDVIQRGLVTGQITTRDMNDVAARVAQSREKVNDPKLLAIMDEVDLRAQVELAKLEMARDKTLK